MRKRQQEKQRGRRCKNIQAPRTFHFRKHVGRNSSCFVNKNIQVATDKLQVQGRPQADQAKGK
jgi:hypothetical protein